MRDLTVYDVSRSMVQHNRDFYRLLRGGVPLEYRDAQGRRKSARARVIDFDNAPGSNRFLAVRELKLTGIRTPNYNRRADLVCFVNGLPLVFIELKAVYRNIREGFDNNLSDYMDENVIAHAFHHNAFLIVSNGDRARYGSITSEWEHFAEWKRLDEADKGSLDAEVLLNGMLAHDRLLDIVENFILFDESKPGATRKVIARNHQVLGVNRAVASVARQEELKLEFPPGQRLRHRVVELPLESRAPADYVPTAAGGRPSAATALHSQGTGRHRRAGASRPRSARRVLAHPGQRQVLFHGLLRREGAAEAGRQLHVPADDRPERSRRPDLRDLRRLRYRRRPDASGRVGRRSGKAAEGEPPLPLQPDPQVQQGRRSEAALQRARRHHRDLRRSASHPGGRLARNMRLALPNAAFIGFTGTPLFKQDELTKRIFGDYVSRYDFKRSEEDGATVKLVYENRGEKLGVARVDLNDRIAAKIEEAELDPDQRRCSKSCWARTTRSSPQTNALARIAADFVEHCATRWESGKSMLVCIDKITCARMLQLIVPRWQAKAAAVRAAADAKRAQRKRRATRPVRAALAEEASSWQPRRSGWMRPSSRSSSARRRTRSKTSRNGASTSSPTAP